MCSLTCSQRYVHGRKEGPLTYRNPDAATREALARRLGPDIRPKTLQIWFQNRRSKSRAKEREQGIPRQLSLGGTREEEAKRRGSGPDMGMLRVLVRDEDRECPLWSNMVHDRKKGKRNRKEDDMLNVTAASRNFEMFCIGIKFFS